MSFKVTREIITDEDLQQRYARVCGNTDHKPQTIATIKRDEEQNLISCLNHLGQLIYACIPGIVPNNSGFCVGNISRKDKGSRVL